MLAMPPGSPVARPLHRWLVERPVDWLSRQGPRKAALPAIGFVVLAALAISAPELLPLISALGDTAGLEVLIAVWLAGMAGSLRGTWPRSMHLASGLARIALRNVLARPRARPRSRRNPVDQTPARRDDIPDEPGLARAFA
jgi:hypothetical protein